MEPQELFKDENFIEYLDVIYSHKISITPFLKAVSQADTCTEFYKYYISKASSNSFFNRMFRIALSRGVLETNTTTYSRHYRINKDIFNKLIFAEHIRYLQSVDNQDLKTWLEKRSELSKQLQEIADKRNYCTEYISALIL